MSESSVEENTIQQIAAIQKDLTQVMIRLARIENPQVSSINLELTQLIRALVRLKDGVQHRFQTHHRRMDALMNVGSAINSSLGLKRVLEEVMDSLITLMNAHRGFLMLKDENGNLSVRLARDAQHRDLTEDAFTISRTITRRVVKNGEAVLTTNAQVDPRFEEQASIAAYHLLSILCAPLKLKDELIGVIYVDNPAQAGIFQNDDLQLISSFANQAAVAIDNARLIDQLQASNQDLEEAYQATLEGWVHALDLRDKETEGHTIRVTEITERLARSMGVEEAELVHIKRGALLHDIGKMGIPDGVLLKPGALTPEERMLIEKHPIYAYEMLSPIKFLQPALDIPYCHHEKWDGSGYPRGLRGEDIPLAARIFAVADVWDALVSNRPYRKGLLPADVRKKIREQAGIHFDPHVVDAFLSLAEHSHNGD
ncbi:MAG: HD-GYP domain-containing protein [Anaerolineales bacterium]|nr:HD-GYP domain-containing protein [Anaerolineales bacterium]